MLRFAIARLSLRGPVIALMALRVSVILGAAACATTPLPPAAKRHNGAGAEALARGQLDDAEARFRLALEYHPAFSEARANLGVVAMERGRLAQAERHLRAALRLNEDLAAAWADLGVVLERLDQPSGASDAYRQALAVDPGLVPARRNLARLFLRREDFASARAQLLRLVQLRPEDADALSSLAYVELRLRRPRAAQSRADEVLARDPDHPRARLVRGLARQRLGKGTGAGSDFVRAGADPAFARHARLRLATQRLREGDLAGAAELVRTLLVIDPLDPAARLVAATLALASHRPTEAKTHARLALRARPDLTEARRALARACHALGPGGCDGDSLAP